MSAMNGIEELAHAVQIRGAPKYHTAVILHLYFPELWGEIGQYLANLGKDFDLFVSVCQTATESDVAQILQAYPNAFVYILENRGRDIGPFMETYRVIAESYRYICKIHSKKSAHLKQEGDSWRQHLYDKLLESPQGVIEIKALFDRFPEIGIIGPAGKVMNCKYLEGENDGQLKMLMDKLAIEGIEKSESDFVFPVGSMFWFRPSALMPLLKLNIRQKDFEPEQGQLDGTLAHAMERAFPLAAKVAGYKTVDTSVLKIIHRIYGAHWYNASLALGEQQVGPVIFALARHEGEFEGLEWIANEKNKQLKQMLASTSWKITEPFRRILSFFRNWVN